MNPDAPSAGWFRAGILLYAATLYVPLIANGSEIDALRWARNGTLPGNYDAAILNEEGCAFWFGLWHAVTAVGLVGMFFFRKFGRELLAVLIVVGLFVSSFLGNLVLNAQEATMASLSGLLGTAIVCASFWAPVSKRFAAPIPPDVGEPAPPAETAPDAGIQAEP